MTTLKRTDSINSPLISVIMPTYNQDDYIEEAIKSVLEQNYTNFELIISDNASTDNTQQIVKRYLSDSRIIYHRNEYNMGMLANMMKAVSLAKGDYCATLPSDDFFLPGLLSQLVSKVIANPQIDIVYSNVYYANEYGHISSINQHFGLKLYEYTGLRNEFASILAFGLHIKAQSTLIKTKTYQDYMQTLVPEAKKGFLSIDSDMFLYFALEKKLYSFCHVVAAIHRKHGKQSTGHSQYHKGQHLTDNLYLWEKYVIPENGHLLSGYEEQFCEFVKFNLALLHQHPEEEKKLLPEVEPRLASLLDIVKRIAFENRSKPLSATPLVSVVMPTKDRPELLQYALESLLSQSYNNWEAIVVNDGGCEIEAIIKKLDPDNRIRYIKLPVSKGHSFARNIALEVSRGEIITYLDDDNVYLEHHLKKVVEFISTNQHSVIYTQGCWISEELFNGERKNVASNILYADKEYSKLDLLIQNFIDLNVLAHLRSCLFVCPHFDESMTALVDWDFILGLSQNFELQHLPEITVEIRSRIKAHDNVSRKERKNFFDLFSKVYDKYPVDEDLKSVRTNVLQQLHAENYGQGSQRFTNNKHESTAFLNFVNDETSLLNFNFDTLDLNVLRDAVTCHQLTGVPLLTIATSIVDNKREFFASDVEREAFLLQVIKYVFDEIVRSERKLLNNNNKNAFLQITQFLRTDRFITLADVVRSVRVILANWYQNYRYNNWIQNHALMEIDAQIHAERMSSWRYRPQFNLFMFLFDGEQHLLADTIDSLGQQFYQNWTLTVIADSPAPDIMFEELDVLEWVKIPKNTEPYTFLNKSMGNSPADWVGFIPAGTRFEPQVWLQFGDYINLFQNKTAFYCDDDFVDKDGERKDPRFKPDFNLDFLRSKDYIGPIICQKALFEAVEGFDKVPGHENMSLAFKIFERVGADGIGHISDVLMHLPETVLSHYSTSISKQAVQQHLIRQQLNAVAEDGLLNNTVRVVYHWPTSPKVSIIIPTKDKLEFLRPCVEATLTKNNYPDFEILIVNNLSEEQDTLEYLEQLSQLHKDRVRVIDYSHAFNYAAISNLAAAESRGEYLLFLNNDTEALHPEWLERLMSHAQRTEVGAVGARLVFPETGYVQHVGVTLGMDTIADHHYLGLLDIKDPGYMGRAQVDQNLSAVTGACLLVRKSVYQLVGGMDEENFSVSYNDIDLCLKIRELGLLVTWTPYSILVHHGSVTQKSELNKGGEQSGKVERFQRERNKMLKKWLPQIANDPAYNRHLSLAHRECLIEAEMPTNWDTNFHDRPKVLGLPLQGGSGDYRLIQPFAALSHAALAQCEHYRFGQNETRPVMLSEYARIAPDTVIFHAAINDIQLQQLEQLKEYLPNVFRIYTIDDLLTNVPEQSSAYKEIKRHFSDAKLRLRRALQASNRLIVSTQPLADLCAEMIDDIHVIPNRLPKDTWLSLTSLKNQGSKPRVGWAGAQQHQGDLAIMTEVIKATAEEVDWIFMGMCPEDIKPYVCEYHHFVPIADYPAKLASLNLDLAVAPLEIHPFNEAKSNLRLLEYGVLGWPVICTDIYPYQTNNPPVVRVKNEVEAWVTAIRQVLADKAALANAGSALRAWVLQHYMLEDHLDEWLDALTKN
jgi:glycosyltransferase involved in cell wall biosynthesis